MLEVYLYDTSNIYIGSYMAQESPLEPGNYIAPEASTTNKPPEILSNHVAVFSDGRW